MERSGRVICVWRDAAGGVFSFSSQGKSGAMSSGFSVLFYLSQARHTHEGKLPDMFGSSSLIQRTKLKILV